MTTTKLYTLFALTGILAAIMAGSGVYLIRPWQTSSTPIPQAVPVQPAANDAEPIPPTADIDDDTVAATKAMANALEALPPIQKTDKMIGNKMQHIYKFPDISLGAIYYRNDDGVTEHAEKAQGTVFLPTDRFFSLIMDGPEAIAMLMSPSIFKKIPGKDFQGLIFAVPISASSIVSMPKDQSPAMMQKSVATALQNLNGWTNLTRLTIRTTTLNKDAIDALNGLKTLRALTIEKCQLKPEDLAKQPFLAKLQAFVTRKCQFDHNPIINQFGRSSSLENLAVDGSISVENLRKLRSCPHLESLQIGTSDIDNATIAEICGMKNLKTLALLHMALSDKQIQMLTKCQWLKKIQLSKASTYGDAFPRIKAMDPRINFERE